MSRNWQKPVLKGLSDRNMILTFTGTIQKVPGRSLEDQMDQMEYVRLTFGGNNWLNRNFAGTAWFREVKVSNREDWHPHVNMVFAPKEDLDRDEAQLLAQRVLDRWSEKADLAGAVSVQTQNAEDLVLQGHDTLRTTVRYASKSPAWDAEGSKPRQSWTYSDLLNHALAGHQLGIRDADWAFDCMRAIERATTRRPGRSSPWCGRSGIFTAKNKA